MKFKKELQAGNYVRYNGKICKIEIENNNIITLDRVFENAGKTFIRENQLCNPPKNMEPVFDFERYKDKEVAVHCKTEKQANVFCEIMDMEDMKWCTGDSYLKYNPYDIFKNETCYNFNEENFWSKQGYEKEGYKIIEFDEIINNTYKTLKKRELQSGDVVLKQNGTVEIVCLEVGALISPKFTNWLKNIEEDLTSNISNEYDIIKVRRPNSPSNCNFNAFEYSLGELIYDREAEETEEPPLWNGMTYEEAHRKMWTDLSNGMYGDIKDLQARKEKWVNDNNINDELVPKADCFACQCALEKCKNEDNWRVACTQCPIIEHTADIKRCLNGLYDQAIDSTGLEQFKLCREIADLEWKEVE